MLELSRQLEPTEERRLAAAWLDPDVTIQDIRTRFRLAWEDSGRLREQLGDKARLGPLCAVSINRRRRELKRREEAP